MTDIYQFLNDHGIEYECFDHPPVYTVADVKAVADDLPGAKVKNLFLRDQKATRHFLVSLPAAKRVNLKELSAVLNATKLSFGSPKRLQRYLGIDPGAVSLLAILNDRSQAVEVCIDRELWEADAFQYHPLVNTSTLVITRAHLERFLEEVEHTYRIIDVPASEA